MAFGTQVFEPATASSFFPKGYLSANRDLQRAFGDDEAAAERHFYAYGSNEERLQVSRAFFAGRAEKLAKFRATLPEFDADTFPVHFGRTLHQLSDYKSESSNPVGKFWIDELETNPDKLYADIGAGLRPVVWPNCLCVEVYPALTADILIDADCKLPFRDASLDGIGCFTVLEHVNQPWRMAEEFARVLKRGAKIFIDWPFLQPVHGYPSHYYNATREGLRSLFAGNFEVMELYTGKWQGPDYTVNWILNALVNSVKDEAIRTQLAGLRVADLCKQPPQGEFWKQILAALDDEAISTLSCGNQLIARRRPVQPP